MVGEGSVDDEVVGEISDDDEVVGEKTDDDEVIGEESEISDDVRRYAPTSHIEGRKFYDV